MRENTWRVARIVGIEIRIDASWIIIALLIAYSFYVQFDERFEDLSTAGAIGLGLATGTAFFASVLVHELAHALVSRARGIPVKDITLFLFGGATRARAESKEPKDEFAISVVGPLSSIALAGFFWLTFLVTQGDTSRPIPTALGYLAWLNLILGIFNLLPGFPLDGGRVLRSILWGATGSLARATRIASRVGQVFGFLLASFGILQLFGGNLIGGLWMAAIGWFLAQAAAASYQQLRVRKMLEDVEAAEVMAPDLLVVPAGASLREAVDDYFMRYDHNAFPVLDEGGRAVGLLTLPAVRQVSRADWAARTARDTMTPLEAACTVAADTSMDRVLDELEEQDTQRVLVMQNDEVIGIITPRDLSRWLRRSQELGLASREP